jgi:hypothetical protein
VAGDAIPKDIAFETDPDAVSFTVMLTLPGAAINELEIVADKSALSPYVVESGDPFHSKVDVGVKPLPFARRMKSPVPAIA